MSRLVSGSLSVFAALLFFSCTHGPIESGEDGAPRFQRRHTEEYFVSSGAIQYFLSGLPNWANASIGGQCHRDESVQYFDYKKLMDIFAYDYSHVVQFQYAYNIERRKMKKNTKAEVLPFKNQEELFFNMSDRIESGIEAFRVPDYKRVHLIWIDPALKDPERSEDLKELMNKEEMDRGYPIFVSLCLYREQVEDFISQHDFRPAIRLMTYEMMAPYTREGELTYLRQLHVNSLFKGSQRLLFYYPQSWQIPPEMKGDFEKRPY